MSPPCLPLHFHSPVRSARRWCGVEEFTIHGTTFNTICKSMHCAWAGSNEVVCRRDNPGGHYGWLALWVGQIRIQIIITPRMMKTPVI